MQSLLWDRSKKYGCGGKDGKKTVGGWQAGLSVSVERRYKRRNIGEWENSYDTIVFGRQDNLLFGIMNRAYILGMPLIYFWGKVFG